MAVISVSVTASADQIVSGIPRTVSISTNIPSSIFYTLDGTAPTLYSNIYISPIIMPTDQLNVILNIMATNGVDTSPIVSETYITNMFSGTNTRFPHSSTDAVAQSIIPDSYPFGTPPNQPNTSFINTAEAGITVDNPALPSTSTGYDGAGKQVGFTNNAYNSTNYQIKYSETDFEGQTGKGIGTLPNTFTVKQQTPPPQSSYISSNMFDPRALVIFQNASTENPNDPPHINRMSFSAENPEKSRDGNSFYTAGLDAPPVNGNFVRAHFNPRTNEITHYYFDSWNCKWIISTAPYNPGSNPVNNLSAMATPGGGAGGRYVHEWRNFARRVLF
jgi:hypothetical protein